MLEIYLVCGVLYKLYFCQKCGEQADSRVWSLETHWDANIQICTDYPSHSADTQSHSQSTYSYHIPTYIEDFCKITFVFFAFVWRVNLSRLRPISTRFTSKREWLPPLKSPILRMKGKESNSKASKLKPSVAFNYDCQSLSYYSILNNAIGLIEMFTLYNW